MGEFWKSIGDALLPVLITLIPLTGMALRAWLQARTRRLEREGLDAWEQADQLSSSAPGPVSEATRELLAVAALRRKGYSDTQATTVARRTRTEPMPLLPSTPPPLPRQRAVILPPEPEPDLAVSERPTKPSPGRPGSE